jgi:hypothetical protein
LSQYLNNTKKIGHTLHGSRNLATLEIKTRTSHINAPSFKHVAVIYGSIMPEESGRDGIILILDNINIKNTAKKPKNKFCVFYDILYGTECYEEDI